MERDQIIAAWRKYGISIEIDTSNHWHWCEIFEDGTNGAFSPSFSSFERCVNDAIACFGPLEDQSN